VGSHESPYGEIRSEWRVHDAVSALSYDATVPANSEATLHLTALSAQSVREGRSPLARVEGVRFPGHAERLASYRLPSGVYQLTSRLR
jgi:alpha-L-rhamnosidase